MKDFFLRLYEQFINLSWVRWTVTFCKENPLMAGIIGGTVLFILVILCIMGNISRKAKKAAKLAANTVIEPAAESVAEVVEETAAEPVAEPVEETAAEPITEVVEEPAAEPIAEPVEETVAEPIAEIVEEMVAESVAEPVEEPAAEPIAEVVEETVAEPVAEPIEEIEEPVEEEVAPSVVEETPAKEPIEEIEEPIEEEIEEPVEEVVEEPVEEEIEEPVEEEIEEPVEEEIEEPVEEVVEEPVKEISDPVEEEKPVEKIEIQEEPTAPVTEIGETIALIEKMDDSVPEFLRDHYEEGELDKITRLTGRWSICRVLTDAVDSKELYFFELVAANGEKLFSSEEYTTYQGMLRGIQTHKTNILNGNIKMSVTKKGDYVFKVLSGKNMLLSLGKTFPTMAKCQKAINAVKRFAETAILDENVQDVVVKVPHEENTSLPTFPDGSVGKWIIFSRELASGTIYYFELFSNNGERLLSGESYTTYIGAVNGIQTFKNNIKKDNFRISLTKRGDYVYKLLNANGQLLCLGEHYRTKRLCEHAVQSIKTFALTSPVLTEEKNQ